MDVVALTMNPAVDVFAEVPRVVASHKLRCTSVRRDPGGGGINVARVASRLGAKACAVYPVGGAIGDLLLRLVSAEGVESKSVTLSGDTRESFTVDEAETGAQFRFVLSGPQLMQEEWRACLAAVVSFRPVPKIFVASGSLPTGVPPDFFAQAARAMKALGAKVVIDTSGPALASSLDEGVFAIKPNLRELQELVGSPLAGLIEWKAAARELIARGAAELIALTLGDQGGLLVTRDQALYAPALPVNLRSAVGAGDSFLGAMVWSLGSDHDIETAFRYGMAAGAAALLTPGTELSKSDDVLRLQPLVRIERL